MVPELTQSGYEQADYVRSLYVVRPAPGTPYEALLDPNYWRHHGGRLRAGDRIEVIAQDGSYDADLRVVAVERLYAKVRSLRLWRDEAAATAPTEPTLTARQEPDILDGIAINHVPAQKWRFFDQKTGEVIDKNFPTKAEAVKARLDYINKRAA